MVKAELANRELARRHLNYFAQYVYDDYLESWHTQVRCDALDRIERGEIRFLIIEAPPRHSKSVHVSQLFPAYAVGKDPDRSIIVSSYSGDLAVKHGRETRNIIVGDQYQRIFKTRLAPDSKAKGTWNTQKFIESAIPGALGNWKNAKGAYNAAGVGGSITGKGAHIFVVDDSLKDRKEAESQLVRDNVHSWFKSVARTRLTPDGAMVVMGTRWHQDDLQGRLLDEEEWVDYFKFLENGLGTAKWVRLRLMAVAEVEEPPYRASGDALWPTRYSLTELADIKRSLGPYEWEALYQQRPISSETQEFKPAWYQYRTHTEVEALTRRCRLLSIDTAVSKQASADFTGFVDNIVCTQGTWNIKAWKEKIAPDVLIEMLFSLHLLNKYDRIGIEEGMYMLVLKPFLDIEMRKRSIYLPIFPLKHNGTQKEVRIRGLIPPYAAKAIFHIEGECGELEFEQAAFPNGKHDDVVDAEAYQLQLLDGMNGSQLIA